MPYTPLVPWLKKDRPQAALYTRVYSPDHNSGNELFRLREIAEAEGWDIAGEFCDFGSARAQYLADRPEYARLKRECFDNRKVDVVLAASLFKLFTTTYEMINFVYKCDIEQIELSIPDSPVDIRLRPSTNCFEVMRILKRYEEERRDYGRRSGLARLRQRGGQPGPVGGLEPGQRKLVLEMHEAYGLSYKEISNITGIGEWKLRGVLKADEKLKDYVEYYKTRRTAKHKIDKPPAADDAIERLNKLKEWDE